MTPLVSSVKTYCTGDCGKGPNMFLRPLDVKLNGMGTPARVTDLLKSVCSVDVPQSLLKATEVISFSSLSHAVRNGPIDPNMEFADDET